MNVKTYSVASALFSYVCIISVAFAGSIEFYGIDNYTYAAGTIIYRKSTGLRKKIHTRNFGAIYPRVTLYYPDDAFIIEIKIEAHTLIGIPYCTFQNLGFLARDHKFEVKGTLFGHWYYFDEKEVCH